MQNLPLLLQRNFRKYPATESARKWQVNSNHFRTGKGGRTYSVPFWI